MREAALSGIVSAQYRLGIDCWSGRSGRVDLREAVRWTCRAAENGSTQAETTLAGFFLTGNALPLDRFRASALLLSAARQGDGTACATLLSLNRMLTRREKTDALRLVRSHRTVRTLIETLIPRNER